VRLLQEVENSPYRLAIVAPVRESMPDDGRRKSCAAAITSTPCSSASRSSCLPAAAAPNRSCPSWTSKPLVNTVAATVNLPPESKQILLEANDVAARCDMLVPLVQQQVEALVIARAFEGNQTEGPEPELDTAAATAQRAGCAFPPGGGAAKHMRIKVVHSHQSTIQSPEDQEIIRKGKYAPRPAEPISDVRDMFSRASGNMRSGPPAVQESRTMGLDHVRRTGLVRHRGSLRPGGPRTEAG